MSTLTANPPSEPTGIGVSPVRLSRLAAEMARRRREALNIYEPQTTQDNFHKSKATERLIRGGRRSGKSISAFAEVARAATGTDPYGKYPTDRPLTIWLILFDEGYIGRTAHRMLFQRGAFKMIKDKATGLYRTYRPWEEEDAARASEARPAPPLIPRRFAPPTGFAWKKKGQRIFSLARLDFGPEHPMTGTEIFAFPSGSEPPMSDPVDLIHIDEDLKYAGHVAELQARLSDRKGRLIWSAAPHTGNNALARMSDRAREQANQAEPDVEEFRLVYSANPYIDPDEKRKRLNAWNEEERQAYDLGEFVGLARMYPSFSIEIHGVPRTREAGYLDEVLRNRQIPADWTRYMVVDPGYSRAAVLFAAVPPPRFGNCFVCYDELYLRDCNPAKFADAVALKVAGHSFRAFIIDDHGSRPHEAGTGLTIRQQYTRALKQRGVVSEVTGSGFVPGCDDRAGRAMQVRAGLQQRPDGTTQIRILREALPNMEREFASYFRRMGPDEASDEPIPGNDHLMSDLEYLVAYNPRYYPPRRPAGAVSPVVAYLKERREKARQRSGLAAFLAGDSIYFGPGNGLVTTM